MKSIYKVFISIGVIIAAFSLGVVFSNKYSITVPFITNSNVEKVISVENKDVPEKYVNLDMSMFWRVLDVIDTRYLEQDDIDSESLLYGSITGMVDSLGDRYTSFYTPQENESFKDGLEGLYEGIGAQLGFKEDQLAVVAPLGGSPAMEAGLKAGDLILAVDGESTGDWSISKAVNNIRGEADTIVTLTVTRKNENEDTYKSPFDIEVERGEIRIPAVTLDWPETPDGQNNIALIRVLRFGSDTIDEWQKIVNDLKFSNPRGVIVDVRDNPGGYLTAAIYLASEFFEDGVVVKRQSKSATESFEVDHQCLLCEVPVAGLISEGSASASEILAGALQARDRAKLIGVESFGKGTVQESIELTGGAGVHVTVAKWLLPNDQNIHGDGLDPDIVVESEVKSGPFEISPDDLQVKEAVKYLVEISE